MLAVLVHHEPVGDEDVWWAESPDVPGFSAAAGSEHELHLNVVRTLRDMLQRTVVVRFDTVP